MAGDQGGGDRKAPSGAGIVFVDRAAPPTRGADARAVWRLRRDADLGQSVLGLSILGSSLDVLAEGKEIFDAISLADLSQRERVGGLERD